MHGDHDGGLWALGVRDCTIQRRFQKLIAEAPSPALLAGEEQALKDAALRLCRAADYQDAATVEFLFDPATRQFSFMEVNPRLQVEHPVTEHTTGVDLVKLSLHVARGGRLAGAAAADDRPRDRGAAERRERGLGLRGRARRDRVVPAADRPRAARRFGRRRRRRHPARVRHDVRQAVGRRPHARGGARPAEAGAGRERDRREGRHDQPDVPAAAARPRRGARRRAWTSAGSTGWPGARRASRAITPGIALLQAAIEVYDAEAEAELDAFFSSAARMKPTCRPDVGRQVEIGYLGHRYQFRVYRQGMQEYRIEVAGHAHRPERRAARARASAGSRTASIATACCRSSRATRTSSRWTACRTGSRGPTPASCGRPGPAIVVARQRQARRPRGGGRAPGGARVDEDGDGDHRAVLRDGPPGAW